MKKALVSTLFLVSSLTAVNTYAATLSATSSGIPSFSTSGVSTLNGTVRSTSDGYVSVANATSSDYVAFNPNAVSPSTFTWTGAGSTFDLNSFTIAGAWGTQTLTIEGYNGASLVNSLDFFVSPVASNFIANWSGLTSFVILTGTDFIDTVAGGSGQHWALNDIVVNNSVSQVPVPAAAFLFAPALLGFLGLRRKAKQA